eukprot:gene42675-56725_t
MKALGTSVGLHFLQDVFIHQIAILYITQVVAIEVMRPQLERINDVMEEVSTRYLLGQTSYSNWNGVVQHFSGACRAARGLETSHLSSARILHSLRDSDIEKCHMYDTSSMGMISMLLIGLASMLRLKGQNTGEGLLVVVWTAVWSSFILVNNLIANVNVTGMEGHDNQALSNIVLIMRQMQSLWIWILG